MQKSVLSAGSKSCAIEFIVSNCRGTFWVNIPIYLYLYVWSAPTPHTHTHTLLQMCACLTSSVGCFSYSISLIFPPFSLCTSRIFIANRQCQGKLHKHIYTHAYNCTPTPTSSCNNTIYMYIHTYMYVNVAGSLQALATWKASLGSAFCSTHTHTNNTPFSFLPHHVLLAISQRLLCSVCVSVLCLSVCS